MSIPEHVREQQGEVRKNINDLFHVINTVRDDFVRIESEFQSIKEDQRTLISDTLKVIEESYNLHYVALFTVK